MPWLGNTFLDLFFFHDVCDDLGHSKNKETTRTDMATALLSSPQARARNSPHDRLCWWYFALFVLKIEFYVGFAFSSPNLKAIKKCDSNF